MDKLAQEEPNFMQPAAPDARTWVRQELARSAALGRAGRSSFPDDVPRAAVDEEGGSGTSEGQGVGIADRLRRMSHAMGDPVLEVRVLTTGTSSQNYYVRTRGRELVFKRYHPDPPSDVLYPNRPEASRIALRELSHLGVTPVVAEVFPAGGMQPLEVCYEWIPGKAWTNEVAQLARTLRLVHSHSYRGDELPIRADTPCSLLQDAGRILNLVERSHLKQTLMALQPAPAEWRPRFPTSIVHSDVGGQNVIVAGETAYLIDWQCPGVGSPVEDLWSFLSPAVQLMHGRPPLSEEEVSVFRSAYGEEMVTAAVPTLAPFFDYRYASYCLYRVTRPSGSRTIESRFRTAFQTCIDRLRASK